MKIFNIIGKYRDVQEWEINWHMLQDSTVIRSDNPFFVPDFDTEFRLYPSLAIRIDRLGKSIAPKFAHRYYAQATLAATVRAENMLSGLRAKGLPWDKAISFDRSCMLGDFRPIENLETAKGIFFHIGDYTREISPAGFKSDIDKIISLVSENNILKMGDIILLTGDESGIELEPGQNLCAEADTDKLLEIRIK